MAIVPAARLSDAVWHAHDQPTESQLLRIMPEFSVLITCGDNLMEPYWICSQ